MKTFSAFLFTTLIFTTSAFAQLNYINCESTQGSNRFLTLIIANGELKQIRTQSTGSLPRAMFPEKILNQSLPNFTSYLILGNSSILEVENKILEGNGGQVRFGDDSFTCE